MLLPRSWLDLHLPELFKLTDFVEQADQMQQWAYQTGLLLLMKSFMDLHKHYPQHKQRYLNYGRSYPSKIIQQRNAELVATILANIPRLPGFPPHLDPVLGHWKAANEAFDLPSLRAGYLKSTVGDVSDLRKKLCQSHKRYQGKNPCIILKITDIAVPHLNELQSAFKLCSEILYTLRACLVPTGPAKLDKEVDPDQSTKEFKAARLIWRTWIRRAPFIKARRAFASTDTGQLLNQLRGMSKGSKTTCAALFSYLPECLIHLEPLAPRLEIIRRRCLEKLETATSHDCEQIESLLAAGVRLDENIGISYEHLKDDHLEPLIKSYDVQALVKVLRTELEQIKQAETEIDEMAGQI